MASREQAVRMVQEMASCKVRMMSERVRDVAWTSMSRSMIYDRASRWSCRNLQADYGR